MNGFTKSTIWKQSKSFARKLFVVLTAAYGVSLTLSLLLHLVMGERWKAVAFINSFLSLLLLPAIPLLIICLLLKHWRLALALIPAGTAFILAYGVLFVPRTALTAPDKPHLSILSYNLNKDNHDLETVVSIIRKANAQVVTLQELNSFIAQGLGVEVKDLYPYQAFHPDASYPGQGILSQFPIESDEYWRIHLGHQRVTINFDGVLVAVYNTHPIHPFLWLERGFDTSLRTEEINKLLEKTEQETAPVIISGDFNMNDLSDDYAHMTAMLMDSYREIGWGMGFTFPDLGQRLLLARLDYVFHSDHFQAVEARVWPESGGSDHRPLYVVLALRQGN